MQISFMQSCLMVVHHSVSFYWWLEGEINLLIISIAMEIDVVFPAYVSNGRGVKIKVTYQVRIVASQV